ncbi:MAG: DUF1778 domain-containing protein [Alphaproteobacteria bacterium]|nr:DUF1778 domain-containing protein [Alphaproteobacteria bacterium]
MSTAAAQKISAERRTDIINIRVKSAERNLIDQAAATQGKNRSDFMLEASYHAAVNALLDQRLFQFSSKAYKQFMALLDAPPQPNAKLRKLMESKSPWE